MSLFDRIKLPSHVIELIHKCAEQKKFTNYSFTCAPGSHHADGLRGLILRITIIGIREDRRSDKLQFIFKIPPIDEVRRTEFLSDLVFGRETLAYNEFLTTIETFQMEKGMCEETGFFAYPKCFECLSDTASATYCLVLEDLTLKGYQLWNRMRTVKLDQAEIVMKELGKLHGISFALRDQKPKVFDRFLHYHDIFGDFMATDLFDAVKDHAFDVAVSALCADTDKAIIDKLIMFKKNVKELAKECSSIDSAEPFVVVNHGDCWINNVMFLYDKNDRCEKVSLFDWQLCRATSPILDILYFIITSTEKSLRDAHYHDLIRVYYNALAGTIYAAGSDPERLFSFNDLQQQLKKFGKFIFVMAPLLLQMMSTDPDDMPDIDEMAERMANNDASVFQLVNDKNLKKYNIRIKDMLRDCVNYGYV